MDSNSNTTRDNTDQPNCPSEKNTIGLAHEKEPGSELSKDQGRLLLG